MFIQVNGVRLFFDVEGPGLVPDGPVMRPRPRFCSCTAARGGAFTDRRVAMFQQLGGDEAGALARRRLIDGDTSPEVLDAWMRVAVPLYARAPADPLAQQRGIRNAEATWWFSRAEGEGNHFDLRDQLPLVRCPTLLCAFITQDTPS